MERHILILYRVGPETVDIVRVIHGARDLGSLLIAGIRPDNIHDEAGISPAAEEET